MAKKNKDGNNNGSFKLPKAWQAMKHRNETAQSKANFDGLWEFIGVVLIILAIAFVLLGGVSQTGLIKTIFNWGHNVSEKVGNWFTGGSVIVNDDGVYIDPSGKEGIKLKNEDAQNVEQQKEQPQEQNEETIENNEKTNANGTTVPAEKSNSP